MSTSVSCHENGSLDPETSANLENSKWRSKWNSRLFDENGFRSKEIGLSCFIVLQILELEIDSTISSKSKGLMDEEYKFKNLHKMSEK